MSAHYVGQYPFEFWEGEQPALPTQQMQSLARAGTDGVSHRALGIRGRTFTCQLTSHHSSFAAARAASAILRGLVGTTQQIVHEGLPLKSYFNVVFVIENFDEVACRANVRLVGPTYNYSAGAALVTRWTMTALDSKQVT